MGAALEGTGADAYLSVGNSAQKQKQQLKIKKTLT